MSLFEFIMVLLSIVVGLGLARILAGWAEALRQGEKLAEAWVPLLLSLLVFVTLVQVWWEAWALHDRTQWNFAQLLLLLVNPSLLYILTHLLFPTDATNSLRAHYFANHGLIYTIVALSAGAALLHAPVAWDTPLFALHNLASVVMLGGAIVLAMTPRAALHACLLALAAALAGLDILAGMPSIG